MRWIHPLLLTLLAAASAGAQTAPLVADPDTAAVRELIALEHHLSDLLNRRDWRSYAPYVADDYVQTTRMGEVRTKAQVIAALQREGSTPGGTVLPDSIKVRVYGDTGVLSAVLTGRNADGTVTFRSRILKTFLKRNGRWYLVAMQGTAIP